MPPAGTSSEETPLALLFLQGIILSATIGLSVYLPARHITLLPALEIWAVLAAILALASRFKSLPRLLLDINKSAFHFWGTGIAMASLMQWHTTWSAWLFLPLLIGSILASNKFVDVLGLTPEDQPEAQLNKNHSLRNAVPPHHHPLFRFVNACEIGMGAPEDGDYVMPCGIVFSGGENYAMTTDLRYLLVPQTVRTSNCALHIYDRQLNTLSLLDCTDTNAAIALAHAGKTADLLAKAVLVPLQTVGDLRLPLNWDYASEVCLSHSPNGRFVLRGDLVLPASLSAQPNPLAPLGLSMSAGSLSYRLSINGKEAGLICHFRFSNAGSSDKEHVIPWFLEGQALLIHATDMNGKEGWWRWRAEQEWDLLKLDEQLFPCQGKRDMYLHFSLWDTVEMDQQHLRFKAGTGYSTPSQHLHHFGSRPDQAAPDLYRHDNRGRIVSSPAKPAELLIEYNLTDQTACLYSQGLNQPEAHITLRPGDWQQFAAYQYQIGTTLLPGAWLLQHRISACGRYLALIKHSDTPRLPCEIALYDSQNGQLVTVAASFTDPAFGAFFDGKLTVYHLQGRREQYQHRPLRQQDQPLPASDQIWDFMQATEPGKLYYRCDQIDVHTAQRTSTAYDLFLPPAATAEGDFTCHHPDLPLAVHYFGSVNEYSDGRMDPRIPFGHGCALISCLTGNKQEWMGISDLAPAMIFSTDGRYLALCYWQEHMRIRKEQIQTSDQSDLWQLYLLDLQQKTLRKDIKKTGNLPDFQSFSANGILLQVADNDWLHEDNCTQEIHINLADLLALPALALHQENEIWLLTEDLPFACDWKTNQARYLPNTKPQP